MDDLKLIKKYYGEDMMHLCRKLFPTILEREGLLFRTIENNFECSKFLYKDLVESSRINIFKDYIYKEAKGIKQELTKTNKSARELLDEVGYALYECKTEEDMQKFEKYYTENEKLCTFRDNRLETNYVFFAVKKDVDNIKRENYSNPKREDRYGTSVISIQFTREGNTLSIKNRYNHRVNNPDATYGNNLENIATGLTYAFENEYGLNINQNDTKFKLDGYVKANDGRYYKYNYEINDIYYCPNNIIIENGRIIREFNEEKEKFIVADYFIIDLVDKCIFLHDSSISDSFTQVKNIKKMSVIKKDNNKIIEMITDFGYITIELNECNKIIRYESNIEKIEDNFLQYNGSIEKINIPNATKIGKFFVYRNTTLKDINVPKVEEIGMGFLFDNKNLEKIDMSSVKKIYSYFMSENEILEDINMPNIEFIEDNFLLNNLKLDKVELENLKYIGNNFLYKNNLIKKIYLPNVIRIGNDFLSSNDKLTSLKLNVEEIGNNFLYSNGMIENLKLPNVKKVGNNFLYYNDSIRVLSLPELEQVGSEFICFNSDLELYAPKLREKGICYMLTNKNKKTI